MNLLHILFIVNFNINLAIGKCFDITVVYGFNGLQDKQSLWRSFVNISRRIQGAWIVMVYLNNVLNLKGRIGSLITIEEVTNFRQCVRDYNIFDVGGRLPFSHGLISKRRSTWFFS